MYSRPDLGRIAVVDQRGYITQDVVAVEHIRMAEALNERCISPCRINDVNAVIGFGLKPYAIIAMKKT